jgi:hypothetical protein
MCKNHAGQSFKNTISHLKTQFILIFRQQFTTMLRVRTLIIIMQMFNPSARVKSMHMGAGSYCIAWPVQSASHSIKTMRLLLPASRLFQRLLKREVTSQCMKEKLSKDCAYKKQL